MKVDITYKKDKDRDQTVKDGGGSGWLQYIGLDHGAFSWAPENNSDCISLCSIRIQ